MPRRRQLAQEAAQFFERSHKNDGQLATGSPAGAHMATR